MFVLREKPEEEKFDLECDTNSEDPLKSPGIQNENLKQILTHIDLIRERVMVAKTEEECHFIVNELGRLKYNSLVIQGKIVEHVKLMGSRIIMTLDERLDYMEREPRRKILDELGKLDSFYF